MQPQAGFERQPFPGSEIGHPDVSFIVAAYNAAPFVEAAVRSALAQRDVGVEVIVADDASTDGTAEIVAALAEQDPRIKLIRHARRAGPSAARNAAMDRARGPWMAILDADDLVVPERSRRLIDLATAISADVVADNFQRFSESRPFLSTMLKTGSEPYAFHVGIAAFLRGNAMFERYANLGYIKAMFRSDFLRAHAIRHPESIFIGEDYQFLLSCLLAGARFTVTSESYYRYRVREGSISWRLSRRDVERLLDSHKESRIDELYRDDEEIAAASRAYARALEKTRVLVDVIGHAKAWDLHRALAVAARNPAAWPLLARMAGAAVRKRLPLPM